MAGDIRIRLTAKDSRGSSSPDEWFARTSPGLITPSRCPGEKNVKNEKPKQRQYHDVKRAAFEAFGNKCMHCGFANPVALQIDHVHGDGYKEKHLRTRLRQFQLYKFIADDPDLASLQYQLLCANCNWIKRVRNREFIGGKR